MIGGASEARVTCPAPAQITLVRRNAWGAGFGSFTRDLEGQGLAPISTRGESEGAYSLGVVFTVSVLGL